ncbi:bacterial transcriptional activator domain-containing protein [Nonomuraea angiospora]|uniref:tetratricopeptide repeat protein n=1 Tax=Nonomuraea angiospora TaxID=46172 RepID=UPI003412E137
MRAQFLRAFGTESRWLSRDLHLLRAYLDLTADAGPLHARSIADLGRRLAAGEQVPSYQINTPSMLRVSLAAAGGAKVACDDPREVPPAERSPRWEHLCAMLDRWAALPAGERAAVAATLSKLGFWATVGHLVPPDLAPERSVHHARLAVLRCNADHKRSGSTPATHAAARMTLAAIATSRELPAATRLAAAVNLIVDQAKSDRSMQEMDRWKEVADGLVATAPNELRPVQLSYYWRGVSFLPFFRGDHASVRRMLDEAEDSSVAAVEQAGEDELLLAEENRHPLLETRARAAAVAGDLDEAERYYRALVLLDPEDSKVHVRLADHLFRRERIAEAWEAYQDAAALGVPYTSYAHTQAARCSLRLGEPEAALAALGEAVAADPAAVTPLVLLRDLLANGPLKRLRSWADQQIQTLTEPLKGRRVLDD